MAQTKRHVKDSANPKPRMNIIFLMARSPKGEKKSRK